MRLFIAIEIPEEVKRILIDAQRKIVFPGKATNVSDFHLTLKFLGEVDEKKVNAVVSELSKISFSKFDVHLSGVGVFPDRNAARVMWVGIEPHKEIMELQSKVDGATRKLGFELDNNFHPHLTLSRIKFIDDKKLFLAALDAAKIQEARFSVSSFKLIKSTLTSKGPIYEVLKGFEARQ